MHGDSLYMHFIEGAGIKVSSTILSSFDVNITHYHHNYANTDYGNTVCRMGWPCGYDTVNLITFAMIYYTTIARFSRVARMGSLK